MERCVSPVQACVGAARRSAPSAEQRHDTPSDGLDKRLSHPGPAPARFSPGCGPPEYRARRLRSLPRSLRSSTSISPVSHRLGARRVFQCRAGLIVEPEPALGLTAMVARAAQLEISRRAWPAVGNGQAAPFPQAQPPRVHLGEERDQGGGRRSFARGKPNDFREEVAVRQLRWDEIRGSHGHNIGVRSSTLQDAREEPIGDDDEVGVTTSGDRPGSENVVSGSTSRRLLTESSSGSLWKLSRAAATIPSSPSCSLDLGRDIHRRKIGRAVRHRSKSMQMPAITSPNRTADRPTRLQRTSPRLRVFLC
jgi:hypothetical protein